MSISVDKAVIARLIKGGQKFEILVDPERALEVKAGKRVPIDDLLAVQDVYEDTKKGEKLSPQTINKTFGTNDIMEIAKRIIREGDVQLTTEQRKSMQEEKRKAIATIISRQGINPQTGAPHPQERIIRAMEEARIRVELGKKAEEQVDSVLREIQKIIPINFEKVHIAIRVPAQYAAKASGIVRNFGAISKEEWGNDGSYMAVVVMSAGVQKDLYDKLNSLTHGDVQTKIIRKEV